MADITMCEGKDCPLKENCYRFKANVNEIYQSYFVEIPYNKEKQECEEFWKRETKLK